MTTKVLEVRPADLVGHYAGMPPKPDRYLWRAYLTPHGDKIEATVEDQHLKLWLVTECESGGRSWLWWRLYDQYGRLQAAQARARNWL